MGQKAEVNRAEVVGPIVGQRVRPEANYNPLQIVYIELLAAGMGQKAKVEGKGLEGKGRGSAKGPITDAEGPIRHSGSHPLRLESVSSMFPVSCHGKGRTA